MSDKKPMVLFFAGPNGSGKSTIMNFFEKVGTYTNADDIVSSTGMTNQEAALFADKSRYDSIKNKEDFTFETVLSSSYKLDILKKAKDEGYFLKGVFVLTADSSVNIARVEARVASGGHNVEPEKIRSRYHKSIANIKELMKLCDILHVYDNTINPVRIVRKHKEDITVFPNEFWTEEKLIELIE